MTQERQRGTGGRPNKRAYLDDYTLNEDGEYEYTGKVWRWDRPRERSSFLRKAWLLLAAAASCVLAAGFVPASTVGSTLYILGPYVAALGASGFAAVSLLRLTRAGERVRDHVYQASVPRMPAQVMVGCVAAIASALGELIHTLAVGADKPLLAACYAGLLLAAALFLGQLRRHLGTLRLKG